MYNFPEIKNSCIALVDVQERFANVIHSFDLIVERQRIILQAARELSMPVIVTEQYPEKLGTTISSLKELYDPSWPVVEKSSFSCFGASVFRSYLASRHIESLVLIGIESHACVQQTAFDALNRGLNVFIAADAVSSRKEKESLRALTLMQHNGISISSVESILLMLLRDSAHPSFRSISKLIR